MSSTEFRSLEIESGDIGGDLLGQLARNLDVPTKILERLGRDEYRNLRLLRLSSAVREGHRRVLILRPPWNIAISSLRH